MAVSPLATEKYPAYGGNYSPASSRKPITEVTVHHMAGVLTAAQCGGIFQRVGRNGSAHYGIGNGGEIANYVDESCVAWANSNWDSNCRAVTIETSNSATGGEWPVSDAAFNSLVKLVADIAKRNNLGNLVPGKNLTWHNMYAATTCPGPYLQGKMQELADKANAINNPAPAPAPTPTPKPQEDGFKVGDVVVPTRLVDYNGTHLVQYDENYTITQINGDRAVLSARGAIWAAMNTKDIKKA